MDKFKLIFELDKFVINVGSLFLNVIRFPYYVINVDKFKKNRQLTKYKKSDVCYIIGLGPSLKNVDLKKVKGDIIATNRFIKYEGDDKIEPNFCCMIDKLFYTSDTDDSILNSIKKYKNTAFLLNGKYQKKVSEMNVDINNCYFTYTWNGFLNVKKRYDFTNVLPVIGNVVCLAILLAIWLDYKKIILLGCDFSSFASRNKIHCYDEVNKSRTLSMSYELFCYSFVAETHNILNKIAKSKGIEIVNASDGSLIDAYYYDVELIQEMKR